MCAIDSLPLTRLSEADARLTVAELAVLVPGEAGAGDDIGGAAFSPVVEQAASAQAAARASRWWRRCMDMADSLLKVCRPLARAGFRVDERGKCTAPQRRRRPGPSSRVSVLRPRPSRCAGSARDRKSPRLKSLP